MPYWYDDIVPDLEAGRSVLVAAHGNSLRALVKHLDGISDDDIVELNIPTGVPLVYELDDRGAPVDAMALEDRYLGDPRLRRPPPRRSPSRRAELGHCRGLAAMTTTQIRHRPRSTSAPTSCRSSRSATATSSRCSRSASARASGSSRTIFQAGFEVQTHRHTGPVWGYTVSGGVEVQGVRLREPRRLVPLRARGLGAHAAVHRGRHAACGSTCTAPTSTSTPTATSRASPTARARSQAYYMLCEARGHAAPERPRRLTRSLGGRHPRDGFADPGSAPRRFGDPRARRGHGDLLFDCGRGVVMRLAAGGRVARRCSTDCCSRTCTATTSPTSTT